MAYSILRVEKIKGSFITGIQIHNQREKELANKDIDKSKTSLNYDLHNSESVNYNDRFKEIIDSNNITRIRKDAVKAVDILTTSDNEFFKSLSKEDTEKYFKKSYEFLANKYGKENIIASVVHLDEKTPHMHTTIVPITQDKKLSAKELYNPRTLKVLQTEYHYHLNRSGFEMQRGVTSDRKHIKLEEFKHQTKVRELDKVLEKKNKKLEKKLANLEEKYQYEYKEIMKSINREITEKKEAIPTLDHLEANLSDFKSRFDIQPIILSQNFKISPESLEKLNNELNEAKSAVENSKKFEDIAKKEVKELKNEIEYQKKQKAKAVVMFSKTSSELERYKKNVKEFLSENKLTKAFQEYPAKKLARQIDKDFVEAGKLTKKIKEEEKQRKPNDYGYAYDYIKQLKNERKELYDTINSKLDKFKKYDCYVEIAKSQNNLDKKIQKHEQIQKSKIERERSYDRGGMEL